jgi:hypothetical protein
MAEDEYLEAFRLDEKKLRKRSINTDNDLSNSSSENIEEEDGEEEEYDDEEGSSLTGSDEFANIVEEEEEEEVVEENIRNKLISSFQNNNNVDDSLFDDSNFKNISGNKIKIKKSKNRPSLLEYYSTVITPTIANEPIKRKTMIETSAIKEEADSSIDSMMFNPSSIMASVLTNAATAMLTKAFTPNEKDIDETFDFLDEELNKIDQKN